MPLFKDRFDDFTFFRIISLSKYFIFVNCASLISQSGRMTFSFFSFVSRRLLLSQSLSFIAPFESFLSNNFLPLISLSL